MPSTSFAQTSVSWFLIATYFYLCQFVCLISEFLKQCKHSPYGNPNFDNNFDFHLGLGKHTP